MERREAIFEILSAFSSVASDFATSRAEDVAIEKQGEDALKALGVTQQEIDAA